MMRPVTNKLRNLRKPLAGAGCLLFLGYWPGQAAAADVDAAASLVRKPGWELVLTQCGGCHSYGLVTNQRGDRQTWLEIIRRMQRDEKMWRLGADVEAAILDYLAENYPPTAAFRRAPLPAHLMPDAAQPRR